MNTPRAAAAATFCEVRLRGLRHWFERMVLGRIRQAVFLVKELLSFGRAEEAQIDAMIEKVPLPLLARSRTQHPPPHPPIMIGLVLRAESRVYLPAARQSTSQPALQ